ncbi:unnamed protein product [Paramecium primaurelia]|uniref:Histidine--tRNA ligase, cytoplasmic n=1 Tax=Paramecium primaurelia TaxID=5886 RepID=A0A8S1QG26_PARPR|nr:unnamed protein product [Paramecium primaurelia]
MDLKPEQIEEQRIEEQQKEQQPQEKQLIIKNPKGTRDFLPQQVLIRKQAIKIITDIFEQHGAVEIDTPVFELREILMGKYGEVGGKLIYDLQDQGGEILSLRYDLTVPFARYIATHGYKRLKRYHVGKVYRRENPSISYGRFREFFQCDFDFAGENDPMVADAELIRMVDQIFTKLDLGPFHIKVSHRKLLDAMINIAGIPKTQFKTVCSSIDKLNRQSWKEVKQELIEQKGVTEEQAEKLSQLVQLKGEPYQMIQQLKEQKLFEQQGQEALDEMELLFNLLKQMNGLKNVIFDLSLARGADYYTGLIQETELLGRQVGPISGGGRYDNLVGTFQKNSIPCVGAAIGIDRIFPIIEEKFKNSGKVFRENQSDFIVATIPSHNIDMTAEKFKIYDLLWSNGIKADVCYRLHWNLGKQLSYANEQQIPYAIIIGEDEVKQEIVQLKDLISKKEEIVNLKDLIKVIKQKVEN